MQRTPVVRMADAADSKIQPRHGNRKLRRFLVVTLVLVAVLFTASYFICGITYREGTKTGVLLNVTRNGILFKTYEGSMQLDGVLKGNDTIVPAAVFRFSVRDHNVFHQLEALQGKSVTVNYRQVIHNFFWQGETDHFIERVRPAEH